MVFAPIFIPNQPHSVSATIVQVETHAFRAAKLGYRVHTQLTVERDGKRYVIDVAPYHTHVAGTRPGYAIGETISVVLP